MPRTAIRRAPSRRLLPALAILAVQTAAAGAPPPPAYDHVVVVMMENHGYAEIIGNTTDAPYINSLAGRGANFTQSFAIEHPSQPNYLDIFSGSNQGITSDACVGSLIDAGNLGGQLRAANLTFVGYSEDLPAAGSTTCTAAGSQYARKHNPWSDFADLGGAAVAPVVNQPFSSFPADFSNLPTLAFVVPNQCHDMHGISVTCPGGTAKIISDGDFWLQAHLDAFAQWAPTHNSLLVVTWDENDNSVPNQIATIFSGALVIPGDYAQTIDHYSLLATLEAMYGLSALGNAASATVIGNVFDHPVFDNGFD